MDQFSINFEYYGRYLDDLNGIWKGSDEEFQNFFETMNNIDDDIKWTCGGLGKSVVYLDVVAFEHDGKIAFKLYQKEQNNFLYIPFKSAHSISTKKGWIKGELIRIARNCSSYDYFIYNAFLFYTRLQKRGYPLKFILKAAETFDYKDRDKHLRLTIRDELPTSKIRKIESIIPALPYGITNEEGPHRINNFEEIENTVTQIASLQRFKLYYASITKQMEQNENFILEYHREKVKPPSVLTTNYTERSAKLGLNKILKDPFYYLTNIKEETINPIATFKINNRLGNLFTHKERNRKIEIHVQNSKNQVNLRQ
jgi:hypothetical protein